MFLSKAEVRPLSGTCQNQPFVSLSGLIGIAPQTFSQRGQHLVAQGITGAADPCGGKEPSAYVP
jgi:hypothetical protein